MKTKKLFLSVFAFLVSSLLHAYTAKINGIYYNIYGTTATVTYQIACYFDPHHNGFSWDSFEYSYWVSCWESDDDAGCDYYYAESDYSGTVSIPTTVTYNGNTYDVIAIDSHAFSNCSNLTSVIIPNTVTKIGVGVFAGSKNLASVTLPNSLMNIGEESFENCTKLSSITLPSSLTRFCLQELL